MKNIIVTGATSMIGTALIGQAVEAGVSVYALIRPDTARADRLPASGLVHVIEADLDNLKNVQIPVSCDALYHFAWAGTAKEERSDPFLNEQNIRYTLDAVELAHKTGCRKFIGAGSQAEYGPVDGTIDRFTGFSPQTAYGISKYAAGKLSRMLCDRYGIVHIWGRVFSVYGTNENNNTLIDYALRQFLKREKAYFSSGTQKWNYLFEKDAGRIFFALGDNVDESGELIVASDDTRSMRDFIGVIAGYLKADELCVYSEAKDCAEYGLDPDISAIKEVLREVPDFRGFCPFEEGIKCVIDKYQSDDRGGTCRQSV